MDIVKTFPDNSSYDIDAEINGVKKFLEESGLQMDFNFFKHLAKGDIIEIYSFPESVQVFSNSEFRRLCSYTNEQMSTIPFPKLFWRDDEVHVSLMRRSAAVCDVEKKICSWDLGTHELVEALHPKKRTFNINLKWIAPCYSKDGSKAVAWISTCCVEFIYELPE